jgi:hypothetical protein
MKKGKVLFIITFLLTTFVFVACGDKDDDVNPQQEEQVNPNDQLVGTWEAVNELGDATQFVFYKDGKLVYYIYNKELVDDIFEGTYVIDDDRISLLYLVHKERVGGNEWSEQTANETRLFRFSVSNNELTLYSLTTDESTTFSKGNN